MARVWVTSQQFEEIKRRLLQTG